MAGARLGHKVIKNVSRIGKKVVKGVATGAAIGGALLVGASNKLVPAKTVSVFFKAISVVFNSPSFIINVLELLVTPIYLDQALEYFCQPHLFLQT